MDTAVCTIDSSKCKTHKLWFFSIFCYLFLYPLGMFLFFSVLGQEVPMPIKFFNPLSFAIMTPIELWLIWHCAYRKPGTKLLTFWLFFSPLEWLISMVMALKESNPWMIGFIPVDTSIFLWCYLMSIKVRNINKTINERLTLSAQIHAT